MDPNSDAEVKVRWTDGTESGYIRAAALVQASTGDQRSAADWCTKGTPAKYQGRIGTLTMSPDSDAEVKLKWDDGSQSGCVKAVCVHPVTSGEKAAYDKAVRDRAAQEKAAREKAVRDKAAREKAAAGSVRQGGSLRNQLSSLRRRRQSGDAGRGGGCGYAPPAAACAVPRLARTVPGPLLERGCLMTGSGSAASRRRMDVPT